MINPNMNHRGVVLLNRIDALAGLAAQHASDRFPSLVALKELILSRHASRNNFRSYSGHFIALARSVYQDVEAKLKAKSADPAQRVTARNELFRFRKDYIRVCKIGTKP